MWEGTNVPFSQEASGGCPAPVGCSSNHFYIDAPAGTSQFEIGLLVSNKRAENYKWHSTAFSLIFSINIISPSLLENFDFIPINNVIHKSHIVDVIVFSSPLLMRLMEMKKWDCLAIHC